MKTRPRSTIDHRVLVIEQRDKAEIIEQLVDRDGKTLVFARTRAFAEQLAEQLDDAGIPAVALHGDLNQATPHAQPGAAHSGRVNVLVATDVAARGIHVDDIDLVIQADAPDEYKTYLHRSGRTGRAGKQGTVVTLITTEQVRDVRDLTRAAGIKPTTTRIQGSTHPVLLELAPGERRLTAGLVTAAASSPQTRSGGAGGGGGRNRRRRSGGGGQRNGAASGGAGRSKSSGRRRPRHDSNRTSIGRQPQRRHLQLRPPLTRVRYSSSRRMRAAPAMARILPSALARGRYFMPQSVAMAIFSGVVWSNARRTRSATVSADSTSWSDRSITPRMIGLLAEVGQHAEVEARLRGLDRDLVGRAAGQLGQERVALGAVRG